MTWGLPCRNSWTFDVFPLYPEAYPLVNVYITNWKIIMLLMCTSTISTGPFSQFANCECHYRRWLIPENPKLSSDKIWGRRGEDARGSQKIPENPRKSPGFVDEIISSPICGWLKGFKQTWQFLADLWWWSLHQWNMAMFHQFTRPGKHTNIAIEHGHWNSGFSH